jgi:O-antigen/teichoic acid export membrane protein
MVRNSAIFAVGEVALKVMTAVLAPLFTRLLTPHEYGVWGLGTMLLSLLAPLFSLGLHGAVTRFYFDTEDPDARARFQGTISTFLALWGVSLASIVLVAAPVALPRLLPSLPFWPYLPILVASALLGLAATVPTATWTAAERAGRVVLVRTASNAVYLLTAVGLVAGASVGVIGVFWARLAAATVLAVPLLLWARRTLRWTLHGPDLRAALLFSLPLVPHLLAHWVLALSDRALLERLAGTDAVGVYTSAYVFTDAVNLVAVSLNGAFVPMLNRHLDRGPEGATQVGRAVSWFVAVVLSMSATVSLLSPGIVRAFFDARYHGAADVAAILGAAGSMQGLYYIWVGALFARKQSGRVPVLTLVGGGVNVALNILWIPRFGLVGAAIATAAGYGALLAGVWFAARLGGGLPLERARVLGWIGLFVVVVAAGLLLGTQLAPLADAAARLGMLMAAAVVALRFGLLSAADQAAIRARLSRKRAP